MTGAPEHPVRRAQPTDADVVGRLLHDFNREYGEPTPGPAKLAERIRELLNGDETVVLLGGEAPDGLAVLRFRPSLWTEALECYLAELYVVPDRRGHGLGRALMDAALQVARDEGADHMDLGTSEDDVAARGLYESLGFTNRERPPDGPITYFYERELELRHPATAATIPKPVRRGVGPRMGRIGMGRKARMLRALKIAAVWTVVFFVGSFLTRNEKHGFGGAVGGIFWFGFLLGLLAVIVLGVLTVVAASRERREPSV